MKRKCRILAVGVALCLLGSQGTARSQDADPKSAKDVISKFSADLSIPDSPAATALGITSSSIVVPHDVRDFTVSLQNVSSARSGQGAAIDVAPMLLFAGRSYSVGEYATSPALRAAVRTTVGVAGAKQTVAGSEYSGTGVSLSTVLFNAGDPVLDPELRSCVNKAQEGSAALKGKIGFEKPDARAGPSEVTEIPIRDVVALCDPQFAANVKSCFAQANGRNWNRSKLAAGFWTTRLEPLTAGLPRATGGNTGWVTFQYGFDRLKSPGKDEAAAATRSRSFGDRLESSAALLLHYRYTRGASDVAQTSAGNFPEVNTHLGAMRFTYGSASRSVYAELSRARNNVQDGDAVGNSAHAFGASFQVGKDLWFNVALGRRQELSQDRATSVTASLKYGTSSEPGVPGR
jgi:hypothetical protein